jgi:hypothetical protein
MPLTVIPHTGPSAVWTVVPAAQDPVAGSACADLGARATIRSVPMIKAAAATPEAMRTDLISDKRTVIPLS